LRYTFRVFQMLKFYAIASILTYITLRYLFWMLLPHFLALFALLILYATYQSLFVYRSSPPLPNQFFLTKDEISKVSFLKRPVLQYPLATSWKAKDVKAPSIGKLIANKEIDQVVKDILQYVCRDYVSSWYSSISDNPEFLYQIEYALQFATNELVSRIANVDFPQLILFKLINLITNHAKEIQNAERLVRASRLNFKDQQEFSKQVELHYGQGRLHPAVAISHEDSTGQEIQYLRKKMKTCIPLLIPPKDSKNSLVLVLVREILASVVLQPLIVSFSDPDYWCQTFDSIVFEV
jgi:hypothetical protein